MRRRYNNRRGYDTVNQKGKGVVDSVIKPLINTINSYFTASEFPGERHAISMDPNHKGQVMQYMGPFTNLNARLARGDPGLNDLDRTAKVHDIAYSNALNRYKSTGNKKEFMNDIHTADDTFVRNAWNSKDDPKMGRIAAGMIKTKEVAEKAGILPTKVFSGAGDPLRKLRSVAAISNDEDEYNKPQTGGIPIGPIISILSTVGPPIIEYLWGKLKSKKSDAVQTGSGLNEANLSSEDKRNILINNISSELTI